MLKGIMSSKEEMNDDMSLDVDKQRESPSGTLQVKKGGMKRRRISSTAEGRKSPCSKRSNKGEMSETIAAVKLEEEKPVQKHKVAVVKITGTKKAQKSKTDRKRNQAKALIKKEEKEEDSEREDSFKLEDIAAEEEKITVTKKMQQKQKKAVKGEPVPRPAKYESLGQGPSPVPSTGKMYVGCHVSGAGGVWNAFDNADECKAKSFAVFLRNQRQWNAKPLDEGTIEKWQKAIKEMPPHLILPHGSYLMNLGSAVPETLEKSRGMLLEEIQRCEKLGIPHYNFHPGATVGKVSREECCKTIAESINLVSKQTKGVIFVLENMSCQGTTVGGDFHELRTIIDHVKDKSRIGVCLDTCHAHASGYDLGTEAGFQQMVEDFSTIVGWQFLRGLHVNDSKGKAGDHLDRHETIGKGTIGIEGFRRIMNCKQFHDLPIILETPWTDNKGYAKEIKILEGLISESEI